MKSMRQLINLMEGVMAVPGINQASAASSNSGSESDMQTAGTASRNQNYAAFDAAQGQATESALDEKSKSEKQARFMAAAAHDPKFAKKVGIKQGVAKEFNKADTGTKQLSNAMKKEGIEEMSMPDNTAPRGLGEKAPPGMEDMVMKLKKEYPGHPEKAFATAWSIYNKKHGKTDECGPGMEEGCGMEEAYVDTCNQSNPNNARKACAMEDTQEYSPEIQQAMADFENMVTNFYVDPDKAYAKIVAGLAPESIQEFDAALEAYGMAARDDADDTQYGDDMDGDFDSAMASAGHGSDEDYGDFGGEEEFEEAFDLNNGYDDINDASGNDYFPSGADSPVVTALGGNAKSGDNPEQKRVAVAEVHKELVYRYRSYLNESETKKKS